MKEKKHLAVNAMVEEWEAKIAGLKADLAAMTSRYSRAAADIASFEDEVTGSKERINQLYASHYQKRAEITRLRRIIKAWEEGRISRTVIKNPTSTILWRLVSMRDCSITRYFDTSAEAYAALDAAKGE